MPIRGIGKTKLGDILDVDFFNRLTHLQIFLLHVEECTRSISLAPSILQIMVRTPFSAAENGPSFTSPTVAVLSSISLATRAPMRRQRSRSAWPSAFVLTRHPPHRGNSVSPFSLRLGPPFLSVAIHPETDEVERVD